MPYFLNLLYILLLLLLSPWIAAAALRKGKYREGHAEKFLGRVPRRTSDRRCIWFHAVSVGEVNLLAPLVERLGQQLPNAELVVSTTTKTGYAVAASRYAKHTVFYCPLDFSWAVRTAMGRIRPDVLVLAELELWPNLVRAAVEQGARVAVVNARLGEKSFRGYRRIRPFVARLLRQIDLVAAQNDVIAERFRTLGADAGTVHVTGSIKFDGAEMDRANPATQKLCQRAGFAADDIVFLAGSTQEPEEALALEAYGRLRRQFPRLRLVLVPRHPERFDEVARLLKGAGLPFARRSDWGEQPAGSAARILLVDRMGELGAWWGAARIAYVGGSLTQRGGQNMIEPAAYGAALSFGPNTWNFRDIVSALLAADAAVVVKDGAELEAFVRRCLAQPVLANELGRRAQAVVRQQRGATDRTVALIRDLLAASASRHPTTGRAA